MKTTKVLILAAFLALVQISFSQGFGTTKCESPIKVSINNVSSSSIQINWLAQSEPLYMIEVGELGFVPGTGNQITRDFVEANPREVNELMVEGLPSRTTLNVYIQTVCDGNTSNWVGPFRVMTNPGISTTK